MGAHLGCLSGRKLRARRLAGLRVAVARVGSDGSVFVFAQIPDPRFFSFGSAPAAAGGITRVDGRPVAMAGLVEAIIRHGKLRYSIGLPAADAFLVQTLADYAQRAAPDRMEVVSPMRIGTVLASGAQRVL